jgi:hypothetical protein
MTPQWTGHLPQSLLCLWWLLTLQACTHNIHVTATPTDGSTATIGQTLRVEVPLLALQGPDRMPGIPLLEWPAADLRQAIIEYARQRGTFLTAADSQGSMTLAVKAWLWVRSRDAYRYILHLESDVGPSGQAPIKSYVIQKETLGSRIRWVTKSDEKPIAEGVGSALDDLFSQIEADAALYGKR